MKCKVKKVVMYIDGVRTIYKDVLSEALRNYISLDEMKTQLIERYKNYKVTFKYE
jgi:hypothetical protein